MSTSLSSESRIKSRIRIRLIAFAAAALAGLILLSVAGVFYALQTAWFKNQLRETVIAAIQKSTGGTVELGEFHYSWPTLTAEFGNLVVHGTESSSQPPLFRADSIRIGLKITSLFKHDVSVASLIVHRPRINLSISPDGSTNVPSPRLGRRSTSQTVDALLNLRVRHWQMDRGTLDINGRALPLSGRGDDIAVVLTYDARGPRYNIHLASRKLLLNAEQWPSLETQIDATARLERDRILIQRATILSGSSNVQISGTLQHFARPVLDVQVASHISSADLAKTAAFSQLRAGAFTINGAAHYDGSAPFVFSGSIAGQGLAYRSSFIALSNVDLHSDVTAGKHDVRFNHLVLARAGAHLAGEAVLSGYRRLQLDGTLAGVSISEATTWISKLRLPWNGLAGGPFHMQAEFDRPSSAFALQSKLHIAPGSRSVPVSGDLDFTYIRAKNALAFGPSRFALPNTQLTFSGTPGAALAITLDSTNLEDLRPALALQDSRLERMALPTLAPDGSAHFDGLLAGPLANPRIAGNLAMTHFRAQEQTWDQLRSHIAASSDRLDFSSMTVDRGSFHATATGQLALENWAPALNGPLRLQAQFRNADFAQFARAYPIIKLPIIGGLASGAVDLDGSLLDPRGSAQFAIHNLDAYGESLNRIEVTAKLVDGEVRITRGRMQAGPALLSFSGAYRHSAHSWWDGDLQVNTDSNGFPLASLAPVRKYEPGVNAQFEIHAEAAAHLSPSGIQLESADGVAILRRVTVHNLPLGSITFRAATRGSLLDTSFSGDFRGSRLSGAAQVQLTAGNPAKGELHLDRIALSTLNSIVNPAAPDSLRLDGFLTGGMSFEGPLQEPSKIHASVDIQQVQLSSAVPVETGEQKQPASLMFRNVGPILLQASNGLATIRSFQLGGKDTSLTVSGSISYLVPQAMNLNLNGSMDLRFFQLLDPNLQSSGVSLVSASVHGTISNPAVSGRLELRNGAFSFNNLPNGLTNVNGTLKFDRDRAEIEKLTAQTGGGALSLGGFVSFTGNGPLLYRLEANAENVRIRYAAGISVTASSQLRLTGTSENSILSGTVTVSRVVFNPNTDVGSLLASAAARGAAPANAKDFLTGMQFALRIESAPNLQLNTELSRDVQAAVDLRLRGTPAHPILLGTITANQGDIKVFGAKYSINHGEVSFLNPAKLEPVLDLDLETQVRGITVDVTLAGTLGKLNINYRSDPPMQPKDIIALLTVGRTPDVAANLPTSQVTNDISALQSGADTVLGQAISLSSNRLSKLFGITNIKIDPMVQGIANTPQARLTVEQDISRQITVTYVTSLSETSEQIFRVEWAFSPQYSIVALRDDNGEFGIDIQYRKRFK